MTKRHALHILMLSPLWEKYTLQIKKGVLKHFIRTLHYVKVQSELA